jgi:hypothetical protein
MRSDGKRSFLEVDLYHLVVYNGRAEPFSLLAHVHHQLGAKYAVGKAGIVLDFACGHQLAAWQGS